MVQRFEKNCVMELIEPIQLIDLILILYFGKTWLDQMMLWSETNVQSLQAWSLQGW